MEKKSFFLFRSDVLICSNRNQTGYSLKRLVLRLIAHKILLRWGTVLTLEVLVAVMEAPRLCGESGSSSSAAVKRKPAAEAGAELPTAFSFLPPRPTEGQARLAWPGHVQERELHAC